MAGGYSNVRAATTEYMFTRVSVIVQTEGERQLNLLFHSHRNGNAKAVNMGIAVPKNLITVHIRCGDKHAEMKLVPIEKYMNAVQEILDHRKAHRRRNQQQTTKHRNSSEEEEEVHIYLATEDPKAYEEFMKVKPNHWHVYIDQYYVEMLSYRLKYGESNVHYYAAIGSMAGRNG